MITNDFSINSISYNYDPSVTASDGVKQPESAKTYDANTNIFGDSFEKSYILDNADGRVAARMPQKQELPQIDSLAGYTMSQIETFYLQGRISRYDYDLKVQQVRERLSESEETVDAKDAQTVSLSVQSQDQSKDDTVSETKEVSDEQTRSVNQTKAKDSDSLNRTMDGILSETQSEAMLNAYYSAESPAIEFEILDNIARGTTGGNTKTWELQLGA